MDISVLNLYDGKFHDSSGVYDDFTLVVDGNMESYQYVEFEVELNKKYVAADGHIDPVKESLKILKEMGLKVIDVCTRKIDYSRSINED